MAASASLPTQFIMGRDMYASKRDFAGSKYLHILKNLVYWCTKM